MTPGDLERVALTLVAEKKGILAADETIPTLTRRFDALGIPSPEQSRRTYREMLVTSSGAAEFISGAIMCDETIRQRGSANTPLAEVLSVQSILPGIKVDTGAKPRTGFPGESITEGLMDYGIASLCIALWVLASPSGGRSSASRTRCRLRHACAQMDTGASGSGSRGLA
jgi:fructose-bisphosphate aldolase class 1